jgi:hypothetical protein
VLALLTPAPGRRLDPDSADKNGSRALARVLAEYGVTVHRSTSVRDAAGAHAAVLVAQPGAYSSDQLTALARDAERLVLLDPSSVALEALAPGLEPGDGIDGVVSPGCDLAGARAAGPVEFGDAAVTTYRGRADTRCYGGALILRGRVAVLGSAGLLRNDELGRRGVAALDVNLLSADRSLDTVTWLLPGADSRGAGRPSVWELFPNGAHRGFVWLLLTGAVLLLWQARRLGPPVREPLPVVVRAAEVVEGHGRLYQRAGARDRAAAALRAGTLARLARHLGLPRRCGAEAVVASLRSVDAGRVREIVAGPPPRDDAQLLELAAELRRLEAVAGVPREGPADGPKGKDER